MTITELINKFNAYSGETVHKFTRDSQMIHYNNEYMKCVRVDSANHHIPNNKMTKMWSIIFEKKKDFSNLPNYQILKANMNIKITPVVRGELKGCWGIRIYNVHQEPQREIVKMIQAVVFGRCGGRTCPD